MIRVFLIVACLLSAGASAAGPDRKALLIGVMNYTADLARLGGALTGPGPDVALMTQVFAGKGVPIEKISVLSDSPELTETEGVSIETPTRANILAALDRLAAEAQAGDKIAIYMAGHGAQIASGSDTSEVDGLDEVFLPSDFVFDADDAPVNVVRDDEIGARIDRMIAAGANVWLIADTCHSGSFRRGEPAVARFVDLRPDKTVSPVAEQLVDLSKASTLAPGHFTGFYAAEAGSLAYELKPPGSPTVHGLMTWALASALRSAEAPTYSELARQVSATLWDIGWGRADPRFEGALGTKPMLSEGAGEPNRFAVSISDLVVVEAGVIDGVTTDTVFSVEDSDGTLLFDVSPTDLTLTQATAPLPETTRATLDEKIKAEGLDPEQFRMRWLQHRAPRLAAKVSSRPTDLSLAVGLSLLSAGSQIEEQIAQMISDLQPRLRLDQNDPDIQIVADKDRLVLHPVPDGARDALSVPFDATQLPLLEQMLQQAAKSRALISVAAILQTSPLSHGITASARRIPGEADEEFVCQEALAVQVEPKFAPQGILQVGHCDTVLVSVHNRNPWPVDLTPLYVAPDNQVYFLSGYRDSEKGGWRIGAGETDTLRYTEATRGPDGAVLATGQMHVLILAERGKPGSDPVDFRYLQDERAPPATRSAPANSLSSLLTDAGFGLAKTRSVGETVIKQSGAVIIPLKTVAEVGAERGAQ
nr:caspase family protein [uncultured Ruegeria sp.]